MTLLFFGLVLGCSSQTQKDTGIDQEALCGGGGDSSLTIGYGSGGSFSAYQAGSEVGISPAPQGGFGVWVRAQTSGIKSIQADGTLHATSSVLLETYIDDELVGSFLNETVEVYCQDDGHGLLWDVAVGFDPAQYSTNEDLISLNDQETKLLVRAIDEDGNEAEGIVDVIISLGM